jgi:chromosome segregation ATPase
MSDGSSRTETDVAENYIIALEKEIVDLRQQLQNQEPIYMGASDTVFKVKEQAQEITDLRQQLADSKENMEINLDIKKKLVDKLATSEVRNAELLQKVQKLEARIERLQNPNIKRTEWIEHAQRVYGCEWWASIDFLLNLREENIRELQLKLNVANDLVMRGDK